MSDSRGYKVIAEMKYRPSPVERGYTGKTLYVNIGDGTIEERPVTDDMKGKFVGGRGFGLWLGRPGERDRDRRRSNRRDHDISRFG